MKPQTATDRRSSLSAPAAGPVRLVAAEVLRSFELLKALSAIGLEELGLTLPLRTLLLDLHDRGERTVPQIAAGRTMTRQSIQASMDQLRGLGLVEARANPAHRRSSIMALTRAGRSAVETILRREGERLSSLVTELEDHDLEAMAQALTAFRRALERRLDERRAQAAVRENGEGGQDAGVPTAGGDIRQNRQG